MSAIAGSVETERSPPTTVPLRHFLVALGFLVAGAAAGVLALVGAPTGRVELAHVHLLLAGWVCVTIAGAMTQFVPVWSGVPLHSRRLASVQLWLLAPGLAGLAASLLAGRYDLLLATGLVAVAGFWTFAYNAGRTLWLARPWDHTERHFAAALSFLVLVTATGPVLAAGYLAPVLRGVPVAGADLLAAHATLGVFGVVLTTVFGALAQLVPMFTQAEPTAVGGAVERVAGVLYPAGVVVLAAGRLFAVAPVSRAGGVAVAASVLATAVVVGYRLLAARAAWSAVLSRYAVVAASLVAWGLATLPAWARRPLSAAARFGAPAATHLLLVGGVAVVVLGTLYHVVPFVVWVHRYSDRLGLESVPSVDDLYDGRLATVDLGATAAGTAGLVAGEATGRPRLVVAAGALLTAGFAVGAANLLLVVRRHSEHSVRWLVLGRVAAGEE